VLTERTKTPTSVVDQDTHLRRGVLTERSKTPTSVVDQDTHLRRGVDQDTHLRRGVLTEGPTDRDHTLRCAATETSIFVISLRCD
jgi:hypothetical protein